MLQVGLQRLVPLQCHTYQQVCVGIPGNAVPADLDIFDPRQCFTDAGKNLDGHGKDLVGKKAWFKFQQQIVDHRASSFSWQRWGIA